MKKERVLIFRFSAMGDVAMTAPVLRELANQNPEIELIIVSRKLFEPFFQEIPNAKFIGLNLEDYKGILGLWKLSQELKHYQPTVIADLHNVLRTKILRFFLSFSTRKIKVLDKGRKEKKALTRKENKIFKPLQPMAERYADVFRQLDLPLQLSHEYPKGKSKQKKHIGIAPFANYAEKMLPLEKTKNIAQNLAERGFQVYLFGGGKTEKIELENWEKLNENIHSVAGKYSLKEELNFISQLQLMISMDSANMHLASLVGTRVISIWGATHPFAGFLGYGQKEEDVVQLKLNCRPCSVFGNKACYKKTLQCMQDININNILNKITE